LSMQDNNEDQRQRATWRNGWTLRHAVAWKVLQQRHDAKRSKRRKSSAITPASARSAGLAFRLGALALNVDLENAANVVGQRAIIGSGQGVEPSANIGIEPNGNRRQFLWSLHVSGCSQNWLDGSMLKTYPNVSVSSHWS